MDAFSPTEDELLNGAIELGGDLSLTPETKGGQNSHPETSSAETQTGFRAPSSGTSNTTSVSRPVQPVEVPDYASQNRFPTYNDLQNAKNCDKPERKVKEIRVFYDDGTYEIFIPAMK